MKKSFLLLVIFLCALVIKSEAKPVDFSLTITLGTPDGKGGCTTDFGLCSVIITMHPIGNSGNSG